MGNCIFIGLTSGTQILFDLVEDVGLSLESTVPEYPTEAGNKVSDAVLKSLPTINLNGVMTAYSMADGGAHSVGSLENLKEALKSIYSSSELCQLIYGRSSYPNLEIQSMNIGKRNDLKHGYNVEITFKQMVFPYAVTTQFYTDTSYFTGSAEGTNTSVRSQQIMVVRRELR